MTNPSVGRIVLLRSDDTDIPAIITAVIGDVGHVPPALPQGGDRVHLHQFAPPNSRAVFAHPEYGIPRSDEPQQGCWRWPERA